MFIDQLVHPVGEEVMSKVGGSVEIVILARCEFHFIREHGNLV